jgi:hypothetical protein
VASSGSVWSAPVKFIQPILRASVSPVKVTATAAVASAGAMSRHISARIAPPVTVFSAILVRLWVVFQVIPVTDPVPGASCQIITQTKSALSVPLIVKVAVVSVPPD